MANTLTYNLVELLSLFLCRGVDKKTAADWGTISFLFMNVNIYIYTLYIHTCIYTLSYNSHPLDFGQVHGKSFLRNISPINLRIEFESFHFPTVLPPPKKPLNPSPGVFFSPFNPHLPLHQWKQENLLQVAEASHDVHDKKDTQAPKDTNPC